MRKPAFCICENKEADQLKLISAFVFTTYLVQFLYLLNTKFQASSHLLLLHSQVCVRPGQKPRRPVFSQRGSNISTTVTHSTWYCLISSSFTMRAFTVSGTSRFRAWRHFASWISSTTWGSKFTNSSSVSGCLIRREAFSPDLAASTARIQPR